MLTAIILSTITLTFSINTTILLLNFISIIRLGSFMSMIVELINLTLLVILVYIGVSIILSLVNGLAWLFIISDITTILLSIRKLILTEMEWCLSTINSDIEVNH